jgi:hypothetical protein
MDPFDCVHNPAHFNFSSNAIGGTSTKAHDRDFQGPLGILLYERQMSSMFCGSQDAYVPYGWESQLFDMAQVHSRVHQGVLFQE